jgi:histidinol dehydrogenase
MMVLAAVFAGVGCLAGLYLSFNYNLASGGLIVLVDDPDAALAGVDTIAPEHCVVVIDGAPAFADRIRNAGAVFVGAYAPAAAGDYAVGVNHVLPTARTARFAGALRVDHFRKHLHVVTVEREGLARLAPCVVTLATVEGLAEHARSITLRQVMS